MIKSINILIAIFVLIVAIILLSIPSQEPTSTEFGDDSEIGKACIFSSDCHTLMSYTVRSNCPFTSFCIDGACRVVCPSYYPEPKTCTLNLDCDCAFYDNEGRISCNCVDGICVAVVA